MSWNSPGHVSSVSSAVDQSAPMEYEELPIKRKSTNDNHNPLSGLPRFSDLFDQPCSGAPVVSNLNINCKLAMSEASIRGVIRIVPTKDKEEDILTLLAEERVVKVQRFSSLSTDGSIIPLKTVTLHFNTSQLPREVIIAFEVFPVKQFIPRPALCRICCNFGHPEEKCTVPPTCKQCAEQQTNSTSCTNPAKCPTCSKPGHSAGTMECPNTIRGNR
ncbi:hypothetical protein OUZ56_017443 [Daphnia magna]|uniref:Pre-C2HC domain-containing protein n=1 Tax=Daphnia magna TaxID=35525 RepID=A0ABR0ASW0_9CRUS|nr:hypothetical protein OUZ56_017443 [Daphnia magna]